MAKYQRRNKRRTYKRYNRRYRTLSKKNIFMKKNAKSQAKQIYALNKRISKIEKATKPEILIYRQMNLSSYRTSYSASNTNATVGFTTQNPLVSYLNAVASPDPERFDIKGNLVRIQDIKLYLNIRRSIHSKPYDIIGRVTILKLGKVSSNRDLNWLHHMPVGTGGPHSNSTVSRTGNLYEIVYGPLAEDITSIGKIVYDKKFKMKGSDDAKNTLDWKIKLFGQTMRKSNGYDWPDLLTNDYIMCITAGFNPVAYDTNDTLTNQDIICMEVGTKISFIDEAER